MNPVFMQSDELPANQEEAGMATTTVISSDARRVEPGDVGPLAEVLARAFYADPVGQWLFPESRARVPGLTRLFESELKHVTLPHGVSLTDSGATGAALWLPPGHWKVPPLTLTRLLPRFMALFGRRLSLVLRGLFEVEKQHPDRDDHFYLPFIGVDPDHQGRGIGSTLLMPVLQTCDRDRIGAYLEATNEDNLRLYERHGFSVVGEIVLPKGPPVWPMWRSPGPSLVSEGSVGEAR
jgi:ribosomal protein S18 acetylase RimI-like enzyme